MYHSSCAVGPDGVVHILNSQTTSNIAGSYNALLGYGVPFNSRLLHFYGTSGNWTGPEEVYPGTDGIYEGHEGIYPDSTFAFLSGWSQIGLDADNTLYIGTQAFSEYYNGSYVSGQEDMHWGTDNWMAEAFIGAKDLNSDGEWVWTRASDINLRPDSIAIKYTKLTENVSLSGPGIVWDETYDGGPPQWVMFARITDFTAPGPVLNLQASRPEANGPVTLSWENPDDEDLAGLMVVRDTVGIAHLVGLRRGNIPIGLDGAFLYNDVWLVLPDSLTGVIEPMFYDDQTPEGTVYYTVVPFDTHYHHVYPIPEGSAVRVDAMQLSGTLVGGQLQLSWAACPGAANYWIHGTDNDAYFEPDIGNRVAVVPSWTTTWSNPSGVGDPDHNWTYLVVAVDGSEQQLCQSNRIGEHDYVADIP
jgi:hypothetical protein